MDRLRQKVRKANNIYSAAGALEKKGDERLDPDYGDGRVEEPPDDPPTTQRQGYPPYAAYTMASNQTAQTDQYGMVFSQNTVNDSTGHYSHMATYSQQIPSNNFNSQQPPHTHAAYSHQLQYPQQQQGYAPYPQGSYDQTTSSFASQPQSQYSSFSYPPNTTSYNTSTQDTSQVFSPYSATSPTASIYSATYSDTGFSDTSTLSPPLPPERALTYPRPQTDDPLPLSNRSWTAPGGGWEPRRCPHHPEQYIDNTHPCTWCPYE